MATLTTSSSSGSSTTQNATPTTSSMRAVSNGFLQGDIPIHFALPLLIMQIALVLSVTRSLAYLFKRIKQPRVLAEIIGGVLLGPTALGKNKAYMQLLFPRPSIPLLETVAIMGLMFYIFMVGLELDLKAVTGRRGRRAAAIGLAGIAAPFLFSAAIAGVVNKTINASSRTGLGPLVVFMGTPLSISAFSVLVRIMAELRLLCTEVGKLAVPCAAVNDISVWTLLAVGVAIAGPRSNPLIPLWVLLCGAAFAVAMLTLGKLLMATIASRAVKQQQAADGDGGAIDDVYVCGTLVSVLIAGLMGDAIGLHPLLGPFLLGLATPKAAVEGACRSDRFAKMMVEKMEDFVTGLMLPLFFASSGLKTNLASLRGAASLAFLALFTAAAAIGKIAGTFAAARLCNIPPRTALVLGFLMNTKGLAALIVVNVGKDLKVLTDETFAILVLTCLFTSFMTFPAASALCAAGTPCVVAGASTGHLQGDSLGRTQQLRVLALLPPTIARDESIGIGQLAQLQAALTDIVEASRGSSSSRMETLETASPAKLYLLQTREQMSERRSALFLMRQQEQKRFSCCSRITNTSHIPAGNEFENAAVNKIDSRGGGDGALLRFATKIPHMPSFCSSRRQRDSTSCGRCNIMDVKSLVIIADEDHVHQQVSAVAHQKKANLIILPWLFLNHPPLPLLESSTRCRSPCSLVQLQLPKPYVQLLTNPPCSIALLLVGSCNRMSRSAASGYRVVALFAGGPDDREALSLALRMHDRRGVVLRVVRYTMTAASELQDIQLCSNTCKPSSRMLDEEALCEFREKAALLSSVLYEEVQVDVDVEVGGVIRDALTADCKKRLMEDDVDLVIMGARMGDADEMRGAEPSSCRCASYSVSTVVPAAAAAAEDLLRMFEADHIINICASILVVHASRNAIST